MFISASLWLVFCFPFHLDTLIQAKARLTVNGGMHVRSENQKACVVIQCYTTHHSQHPDHRPSLLHPLAERRILTSSEVHAEGRTCVGTQAKRCHTIFSSQLLHLA